MAFALPIIAERYLKRSIWLGSQRNKDHARTLDLGMVAKSRGSSVWFIGKFRSLQSLFSEILLNI